MATTTNFENAMESIGQALFEMFETNTPKNVVNLLEHTSEGFTLVTWPESQNFMEESWFSEEAILAIGSEDKTGSAAYFIPIKRLI